MPPVRNKIYGPRGDRNDETTPRKLEYMRKWRERNPEKVRAYNRKSYRNRRFFWKRVYGITKEGFENLINKQGGRCAICQRPFDKTPHIDHDHETGRIRGLLCSNCNTGLGKFREDPELMERGATYLRASVEQTIPSDSEGIGGAT